MNKHTTKKENLKPYKIDCEKCCGLCCTALCFVKAEGFPENKAAGKPCVNLTEHFLCRIHEDLGKLKMRGCIGYDCFGAGNYVIQDLYQGETWRSTPKKSNEIFEVFQMVFSLFQIRYYLEETRTLSAASDLWLAAEQLIIENEALCQLPPQEIISIDLEQHRRTANVVLKEVCRLVSGKRTSSKPIENSQMLGKNFKNRNLSGLDLSMKLLIGARFDSCVFKGTVLLGADTRDADFSHADLSEAIFLTQGQVNAAKGNMNTKLPEHLEYPPTWC